MNTWWILFNPLTLIFLVMVILIKLFESRIIGWFGEFWTKSELKKLPKNEYNVINDVLIEINGKTIQIDHIVVSKFGIFVVETKQYNGFIVGNKYDENWVRYVGKKKINYENPIRQNYGHCKAIEELLKIDGSKIFNIVCIPSRHVVLRIKHDGELVRNTTIIEKILSYKKEVIDNSSYLLEIIESENIKDEQKRKEHVKNIKKTLYNKINGNTTNSEGN